MPSWYDFEGDLKFLCGSLTRLNGLREEVTFVHQAARDFLEVFSRDTGVAGLGGIDMDPHAANEQLAAVCVQYLLKDEIFRELERLWSRIRANSAYRDKIPTFLSKHLFLRYAIESWAFHSRALGTSSSAISTMIRRLLSSQTRRDDIMMLTYFIYKQISTKIPRSQTPLHLAAYFNISWLAQMYISADRTAIHGTTNMMDTTLIWARKWAVQSASKYCLMQAQIQTSTRLMAGLHFTGQLEMDILALRNCFLKHGASLDQRDRGGYTPLNWAKGREHWDLAHLLQRSADGSEHGRNDSTSQGRYAEGNPSTVVANWNTGQLWDHRP